MMKFRTLIPYVLVAIFLALAIWGGTNRPASAALVATLKATAVQKIPTPTAPASPTPGGLQGVTTGVETPAANVTPTPLPLDASQIHILYQTADPANRTCDVNISDLVGQNVACIAQTVVSDTLTAAQTAYGISATDKTVTSLTSLDAMLSADASKAVVVPHVTFSHGKTAFAAAYRIYLIDVQAGSSKTVLDRTDKQATPPVGGNAALAPDSSKIAYTDQNAVFVAALDGSPARQLTADPAPYGALLWSPDGKQILVAAGTKVLMFDSSLTKDKGQALALAATGDTYQPLSWSSDGTQVIIADHHAAAIALYVYTLATNKVTKFAPRNTVPDFAIFIPNSSRILFGTIAPKDGTLTLFTANSDGSVLLPTVSSVTTYGVAPDGSRIVYTYLKAVYASNINGGDGLPIVDGAVLLAVQPSGGK